MVHTLGKNPYQVYNKMSDGMPGYDGLGTMGPYYVVLICPCPEIPGAAGFSFSLPLTQRKEDDQKVKMT